MNLARRGAAGAAVVWRGVSATGRGVLAVGALAWLVGWRLGWDEFLLVAGGCLVAVAAGLLLTIGRTEYTVALGLDPVRLECGERAVGRLAVTNAGGHRVLGTSFEVPAGTGFARFAMPSLAAGDTWEDIFVVPTTRRCILTVGPASTVRGDPLGLARRTAALTDPVALYVHPRTVRVAGMTAGWIRDLEGRPTNDLSPSDVAFHTMREYVPGDDRRHIHWRSSAKLDRLMVRQFVDSRRSHLGLVLATNPGDYADDDEFELAVSVIGSLGRSALLDEQAVTVTTGGRPLPSHGPAALLDALAGVEPTERKNDLSALVKRSIPLVRGASVVGLVTGSAVTPGGLRAAAQRFHHDVRVLAVRVRLGGEVALQTIGSTSVLELGVLEDLSRALRATVSR